jgi:hypothetical protein
MIEIWRFLLFFPSLLAIETLQNHFIFDFLILFSRSSASKKNMAAVTTRSRPTKTKLPSRMGLAETAFLVGGRTEVDDNRRHHQQP